MRTMIFAAALALSTPAFAAGIPVFDAASMAEAVKQAAEMKRQYDMLYRQYASITGTRNLGDLLRNTTLRRYLPPDARNLYDAVRRGSYGGFYSIAGAAEDILESDVLKGGDTAEEARKVVERRQYAVATNRAMVEHAYEGAQARLDQIERLADEINRTQDGKAIAELQARIAIEQAAIQNETAKLELLAQLQGAELRMIEERQAALGQRILSSTNTGMPAIR